VHCAYSENAPLARILQRLTNRFGSTEVQAARNRLQLARLECFAFVSPALAETGPGSERLLSPFARVDGPTAARNAVPPNCGGPIGRGIRQLLRRRALEATSLRTSPSHGLWLSPPARHSKADACCPWRPRRPAQGMPPLVLSPPAARELGQVRIARGRVTEPVHLKPVAGIPGGRQKTDIIWGRGSSSWRFRYRGARGARGQAKQYHNLRQRQLPVMPVLLPGPRRMPYWDGCTHSLRCTVACSVQAPENRPESLPPWLESARPCETPHPAPRFSPGSSAPAPGPAQPPIRAQSKK
jgi:hypothetical protein